MKITIQEIDAAITKTGLKVITGIFEGERCGCPLMILCTADHPSADQYPCPAHIMDWAEKKYGEKFPYGFMAGVDGDDPKVCGEEAELEDWQEGYNNGQKIAQHYFGGTDVH